MAAVPLRTLTLRCSSLAEQLGMVALGDAGRALGGEDGRIIGGHMITLHIFRWRLDLLRETRDADLGLRPAAVRTPEFTDRLHGLGYERTAGNRFEKVIESLSSEHQAHRAVIDVLVPTYTSRARSNLRFGDHLVTTEVPGLATALQRPAVEVTLDVTLLDGSGMTVEARLPDEVGALILKVMARTVRNEDRDAVDIWRALEVCAAAGVQDVDFGADDAPVRRILTEDFGPGGKGIEDIARARALSTAATMASETRIQALKARVAGL